MNGITGRSLEKIRKTIGLNYVENLTNRQICYLVAASRGDIVNRYNTEGVEDRNPDYPFSCLDGQNALFMWPDYISNRGWAISVLWSLDDLSDVCISDSGAFLKNEKVLAKGSIPIRKRILKAAAKLVLDGASLE